VRRTTLAVVLATGALSVPAVALAAGGEDSTTGQGQAPATTPVQEQQQQQPDQPNQAPRRGDCPKHDGGGSSSGGSSGSDTTL
jgi:hypothetical protein